MLPQNILKHPSLQCKVQQREQQKQQQHAEQEVE